MPESSHWGQRAYRAWVRLGLDEPEGEITGRAITLLTRAGTGIFAAIHEVQEGNPPTSLVDVVLMAAMVCKYSNIDIEELVEQAVLSLEAQKRPKLPTLKPLHAPTAQEVQNGTAWITPTI